MEEKCHYLVGNTQELQRRIGDLLGEQDRVMSDFIQLEEQHNKRRLELESPRSESRELEEIPWSIMNTDLKTPVEMWWTP